MEPGLSIARFVFLRVLGLCLVCAFVALFEQLPGLIGPDGISPLDGMLASHRRNDGCTPWSTVPSLLWLWPSCGFAQALAALGVAAGAALTLGVGQRLSCLVAYAVWLSFRALDGGVVRWFNFPFDDLQAEMLVIGTLLAPWTWSPRTAAPPVPRWVRWLVVWFAFRLMFGPGLAKVLYHAPWRDLTAIDGFLVAMPHPTAAAAWCHDLGAPFTTSMAAFALFAEVLCPWLYFVPGWPRRLAAGCGIALMVGIQLVCNIRGFQPLTGALLLLLWDDAVLIRLLPNRWRPGPAMAGKAAGEPVALAARSWWRRAGASLACALLVFASIRPNLGAFGVSLATVSPKVDRIAARLEPFHLAGVYAMFCIVPDQRFALIFQGSDDGEHWSDYEPRGIPAATDRPPGFFAPYHDYLGFRLWLAAFGPPEGDGWLRDVQQRLLAGSPAVQALFHGVPFPDRPPALVRVEMVRFRFASPETRAKGEFWLRESIGIRAQPARRM